MGILTALCISGVVAASATNHTKPYLHVWNNADIPIAVKVSNIYRCWESNLISSNGGYAVYQPDNWCKGNSVNVPQIVARLITNDAVICELYDSLNINTHLLITGTSSNYQCNLYQE